MNHRKHGASSRRREDDEERPESSSKRGGSNRPPGLRGKEIGLYYRDLARKKRETNKDDEKIHLGPSVSVPEEILKRVSEYLEKSSKESNENETITHEFEARFRHLLKVNFEEFINEAKDKFEDNQWNDKKLNALLREESEKASASEKYLEFLKQREKLPAMKQRNEILSALAENQILLIVGSTGCGKTTQVPQMILDQSIANGNGSQCRIVCTQPRRISAISVAERVAYERCEPLGKSVGYQIRLESRMPRPQGSVLYCTTGVLLQKLQSDPLMSELSTLILDEIHERSVETDLLMALIKKILPYRPDLKIILMSATVSEETFITYFENCQTLRIEGTLFPVKVKYLEDVLQETSYTSFTSGGWAETKGARRPQHRGRVNRLEEEKFYKHSRFIEPYLSQIRSQYDRSVIEALRCPDSEGCNDIPFLEHLIFYICENKPPGAILVFLPGYDKISKLHTALQKPSTPLGRRCQSKIEIYPLHSMMPTVYQRSVFQPPPEGTRKIILSTIIAETSVTIDDVVYVINTGRTKITDYNFETNIQSLEEAWTTKANSQQRKGRAGRVQPGECYNLFSRARESAMDEKPTPEILRCRLESIILNLKLLHITDPFEFMKTLIDVPNPVGIQNGIRLLKRMEAIDDEDRITPLGMHLARLPIDPQSGKMILMAALFRCLDPITSAAAGLSFKSPFFTPLGKEREVDRAKRDLADSCKSDHLLLHNVIKGFREARQCSQENQFCYKNFLSRATVQQLENMKHQFTDLLSGARFLDSSDRESDTPNLNSKNLNLVRAIIASGLYPNMAYLHKARQIRNRTHAIHKMSTPEDKRINFHPSSVCAGEISFDSHYFVYFVKQKTAALYILDATMVFPMALLIFGDHVEIGCTPDKRPYISVGRSYHFRCSSETANLILSLRERLEWLLRKKALHPSPIAVDSAEECIVKAIEILLSLDDGYMMDDQYPDRSDDGEDSNDDEEQYNEMV